MAFFLGEINGCGQKVGPALGGSIVYTLRRIYPRGSFYIAHHVYPPVASFHGIVRPSELYVIRGECLIKFSAQQRYCEGDVASVAGGEYEMCAQGISDLEIAFVCDLRELLKQDDS
jgi:hypothetical protein